MKKLLLIPDLGGEGEVVEILVNVGDKVEVDQGIMTLESSKASMEVPTPIAGVISALKFKMGDTLKEGDEFIEIEITAEDKNTESAANITNTANIKNTNVNTATANQTTTEQQQATNGAIQLLYIPDLGGEGEVVEILVNVGDKVEVDQGIMTLESSKASMEVPTPIAGVISALKFKMGDTLKEGDEFIEIEIATQNATTTTASLAATTSVASEIAQAEPVTPQISTQTATSLATAQNATSDKKVHAGPKVRLLARDLGVNLSDVSPTGPRGRILKEDVQSFVKNVMQNGGKSASSSANGIGITPIPAIDFAKFGAVEEVPLSKLMQLGAKNLHQSWLNVPHVTHFDNADITELEHFRVKQKAVAEKAGTKLTILPFLLKACAHLLQEFPDFNSSLAPAGKTLIRKKYVHIGFACDTPDGLLVPVIRDVNQKSLLQLALEAAELADKARNKKLGGAQMQGACFTISSLGHIGGTGFTPIVNAPEVAILGVNTASMQPVWNGEKFTPRLLLPLSLSYDHRVINGAAAARFSKRLSQVLADIRSLLL